MAPLAADPSRIISAGDRGTVADVGGSPVERNRSAGTLAELVAEGRLDPLAPETFALEEAGLALAAVEAGHARGKVALRIG